MDVSKITFANQSFSIKPSGMKDNQNLQNFYATNPVNSNIPNNKISLAFRSLYQLPFSAAVSFRGTRDVNESHHNFIEMIACLDPLDKNVKGEFVGSRMPVHDYVRKYAPILRTSDTNAVPLNASFKVINDNWDTSLSPNPNNTVCLRFTQTKPVETINGRVVKSEDTQKQIIIGMVADPTDKVSVMQIKNKLTPIVRMPDDVIMVANGKIERKEDKGDKLVIVNNTNNASFNPVKINVESIPEIQQYPISLHKAGKVIIGLQEGRYCKELINSLVEFKKKVDSGIIDIPTFEPRKDANKCNVLMLAGGFGSRAEYTNATSNSIYKSDGGQANNTKGSFLTPTGLTPMETSLITLHLAGLFNCTNFEIGTDLMFYMNPSDMPNKGNGGFTLDMYDSFPKVQNNFQFIMPNDSVSRMTKASKLLFDKMNEGKTALAMISKKVPSETARGNFGIMRIDSETGEILEFSEKPKVIPTGFELIEKDENNNEQKVCLSNTFQFAVSPQAVAALKLLDKNLQTPANAKESRDWSSQYVPTLMVLSQYDNVEDMVNNLQRVAGKEMEGPKFNNFLKGVDEQLLLKARESLRDADGEIQKIVSIPTDELWYDVGQLDEMYSASLSIATDNNNKLGMLPYERKNAAGSVNPNTGLIACSAEELKKIEDEFNVQGRVFVAPKAKYVDTSILESYPIIENIHK